MDGVTLPPAEWRNRPGLERLVAALGGRDGEARFVGGAVRDTLLDLPVADIDVATTHQPLAIIARLEAAGIKAIATSIEHGTITAVSEGTVVEVTTLRRDLETDGRHAVIAYTDDWKEDAGRRDFTINALYADPISGEIFDWFGGLADLAAGRVRFIGDPYQRIAEDHLRILRFFRFHARFGDAIDEAGLDACIARANDLMALSRERIWAELSKLLVAKAALSVTILMVESGILRPVLPEIVDTTAFSHLIEQEMAQGIVPDPVRRLAALIAPDQAEAIGARLKLSKVNRKRLSAAHGGTGHDGPRGLAYRVGPTIATDRLLLAGESVAPINDYTIPKLPISGGDIVARGIAKGPQVASLLRQVESEWIAQGFPDAAATAGILDQLLVATSKA